MMTMDKKWFEGKVKNEEGSQTNAGVSASFSNELLCCPFCGELSSVVLMTGAEIDKSSGREPAKEESYVVICSVWSGGCGAAGGYGLTKNEALSKWSVRDT